MSRLITIGIILVVMLLQRVDVSNAELDPAIEALCAYWPVQFGGACDATDLCAWNTNILECVTDGVGNQTISKMYDNPI